MLQNKDEIRDLDDMEIVEVAVPEWLCGIVRLRSLEAWERDEFDINSMVASPDDPEGDKEFDLHNLSARLVARVAVDGDGNRIFDESDAAWLGKKSAVVIMRLKNAAMRLAGLTVEDAKELAKNLQDARRESSNSN